MLRPQNQIGTMSILKELKVRGRVEQGRRCPRKPCKTLTYCVRTGHQDELGAVGAAAGGPHPEGEGPHPGFRGGNPVRSGVYGMSVGACPWQAGEKQKEFQVVLMSMQRPWPLTGNVWTTLWAGERWGGAAEEHEMGGSRCRGGIWSSGFSRGKAGSPGRDETGND